MKISELPGDEDSGPTCRTYVFQNESHTLGNALKCIINRYEDVDFCGYTVPHPAESKMHFRIQSRETPALEILKRGLKDLEKVCDHTIDLFEKEVKDFSKMYLNCFIIYLHILGVLMYGHICQNFSGKQAWYSLGVAIPLIIMPVCHLHQVNIIICEVFTQYGILA